MTAQIPSPRRLTTTAVAALSLLGTAPARAADTDIYGPPSSSSASSNVVFLLDNTSNWSANNQAWSKTSVNAKCNLLSDATQRTTCLSYSSQIFGAASSLTQGQVQLRALKLVLNELVCSGSANALRVNVGLSLLGSESVVSNGHSVGLINFAVQPLTGTATTAGSTCAAIINQLDLIDTKVQDPAWKAPSNANYGAAYYEIFKYFGGHTNPALAPNPEPHGGTPIGATGYGPIRYSKPNMLDDVNAFTGPDKSTYRSPLTSSASCGNNYIVLVGNTYPNAEPSSNGGPTVFNGINYTPPALSAITSDTSRYADEWAYFLANTDVSDLTGVQRVATYAVNTYNASADPSQTKLLKSMAAVGGIGAAGYLEVGGDLYALVLAFKNILSNIAAVNSVFTATTLPVSTTTQGTFLNQIFVGMFRPDATAAPRWVGNLKQYQLGLINGALALVDKNNAGAVQSNTGLFSAGAQSMWTVPSVFFDQLPSGSPASASDSPDGSIVEKGGAAQKLRTANLQSSSGRNMLTLSGGVMLPFSVLTAPSLTAAEVAWTRGENNVASGTGMEAFVGSYSNGAGVTTQLGSTGARHSIHGDVLHSRPVALNYGSAGVVVYYGSNDGIFHAVDGNKADSGGGELWSFVAPEHISMIARLRGGSPKAQLPETNSAGATLTPTSGFAPRDYGMDGPIGVYAIYNSSTQLAKATIYPAMRRGGRSVYAFDVTNRSTPLYKWKITGGSGSYSALAQTWSMPKPVVVSSSASQTPIVIMGGGYDPAEDTNTSGGIGNRIYVINGDTGALIKEMTTAYSVPSDVTVVDVDGNGEPDRAYVSDVRGNLYRVDFPTSGSLLDAASWSATSAVKIASLGGKVFFAPDVVVTRAFVAVLVGTGDREKPLLNVTADKFLLVKDNVGSPRATPLTVADLTRVAKIDNTTMQPTQTVSGANNPQGCYLELATAGEKVVNAPFSIAGATYFGTNRPRRSNQNMCAADLGEAFSYQFPLFCGVPSAPTALASGGLPPSPVGGIVTINVNGVDRQVPFLIGGTGPSSFDVKEPKPPIPPVRTRQSWRIDNNR